MIKLSTSKITALSFFLFSVPFFSLKSMENEILTTDLKNLETKELDVEENKILEKIKEDSSDENSDNDDDIQEEICNKSNIEKLTKVISVNIYGDDATYGTALLNKTLHKALGISKKRPKNSKQIMKWFIKSRELDHEVDRIIREQTLKLLSGHPNKQISYITQLVNAAHDQGIELSDNAMTMILCSTLYQEHRINFKKKCTNNKLEKKLCTNEIKNKNTTTEDTNANYIKEIISMYEKTCTKSKAEPVESYWFTKKVKKYWNETSEFFSDKESSLEKVILTGTLEEQLQIDRYQSKKFIKFIHSIAPNADLKEIPSSKAEEFFKHLGHCMTTSHKTNRYIQELLVKTQEEHENSVQITKFNKLQESIKASEDYGYFLSPIVKESYNYVMELIGSNKTLSKNTRETMKTLQNKFISTQKEKIEDDEEKTNN